MFLAAYVIVTWHPSRVQFLFAHDHAKVYTKEMFFASRLAREIAVNRNKNKKKKNPRGVHGNVMQMQTLLYDDKWIILWLTSL